MRWIVEYHLNNNYPPAHHVAISLKGSNNAVVLFCIAPMIKANDEVRVLATFPGIAFNQRGDQV